ncbi:hypothetical protein [Chitinimonas sp. BJB300]|uniref:hypothetical protein n=1 Tax=Chitinimonas sp. BJB300 TaxID=1559339 RepID=UPI000C10FBB4|nr:hypothetical protein [Chitinimonas sp. BJB300]PHV09585.1 hypothetical protein CSQ89_20910 [Chitinimonas sp. BJB300]TSJ83019.1 hypothetical protein FG002_021755 [Chitinimonas sp. BJB300]
MSTLLADWCSFCEEGVDFDKSHFLGLFKEHSDYSELKKIFSFFPSGEEMALVAKQVLDAGTLENCLYLLPTDKNKGSQAELLATATKWLNELSRFCKITNNDELYIIAMNAQIIYTERDLVDVALKSDIPECWMHEFIGDQVREARILSSDATYALFEALYGIAANYYLAWHIGKPLINLDIDFTYYFEFWRLGGVSALSHNELLVSHFN